ncbi:MULTISPECIES: sigma-G-dependent sporulation-specific acid-soluble spore protein CsgA [unclassified Bacillus (in: firmicutes)]|uniref:sigma-G-dependent sporulation-specific acid-soluble spore protein CsgA n=1 Tax=unclassified Bacillus (in: firmicutes) TaxID=185979 RepID=UPI001BE68099|nr:MULTISPECIES: sigma-G-dependent sporulation-specific acid-soluble spore protein CsgA [unclassified Bacillus (in: firmicutes)]MBT2639579.1 sigma-G-dependent sporulation-specific acid-soluble spore protein CsgA [Bacillus sp. ISL-39]MBT2662583.1 sigma-G-dependent sporulation-specific acid-soluble spore protein CsgA [Bacillus sp. ISL-45]
MEKTQAYLREIISNYTETYPLSKKIYHRLEQGDYPSEGEFVKDLTAEEIEFLNKILPDAIEYAKNELDDKRAQQLNEVYELLY